MSIKEKKSKVVNNKDDNFYFSLITMPSYLFNINPNNKTNNWLINTGVTNYITYNIANFLNYTKINNIANFLNYIKINNLEIITIVNSLVCLKGIDIV
jgi:hypothetical protein